MFVEPETPQVLNEEVLVEQLAPAALDPMMEEKLSNLVFKLRSYQDPDMGEYAAGVEAGMSRAADMLQNLINRLKGE